MVFTAKDLSKWENFPKGLRVLLLDGGDGDGESAGETRSKLESMDYIVSTFTDESEALSAVFKNPESFHIAIVEVNKSAENETFKFLEAAKEFLPTIMISTDHCIKTTMNCIALGAVEFLQKPLSSEKLKNIWQHVVHKAFNDGRSSVSESLKPVKKSVVSTLHLDTDMTSDEKDPAPSTPQLKQVSRLLDGDENVNSSTEKESVEDQDIGESKSVDTTTNHEYNVIVKEEKGDSGKEEEEEEEEGETEEVKEKEEDKTEDLKSEKTNSPSFQEKEDYIKPISKSSGIKNLSSNKASRKKVDWTQDLHNKFVEAVELLGVDNAIPSRILELMKVNGLTRHNVASHLQKFRMHRRNILPKVDHNNQRWIQSRENHRQIQRHYNGYQQQHRPVMAYPVWGLPGVHHPPGAIPPLWPPPLQSSGQLPPWHWQPPYHPTVNGNAWGCPVGPPMTGLINTPNTNGGGYQYSTGDETGFKTIPVTQPDEEMIDQVVKEAISKPWLPLPLGLKPPSADSVLAELSRQGISAVPSSSSSPSPSCHINGSHRLR